MDKNNQYCFLAFGELAVDILYNNTGVIYEKGGVSAFNTLYYLSVLGKETYAFGGVGYDNKYSIAVNSLKDFCVDTDHIEPINKETNVFYIYKPRTDIENDDDVEIGRVSPNTGKSSIVWTDELRTNIPEQFIDRNVVLIVSNFEPVTRQFVRNVKNECKNSIISLDITNEMIFKEYTTDEIWEYLSLMDLLQCNEKTAKALCNKLKLSSANELFSKLNVDIFTLTNGSQGATFFYRDNDKEKIIIKKPEIVAPLIDPTGAGDAFHAMLLISFCNMKIRRNLRLDSDYFNIAFNLANLLSRKVVQTEGARLEPYDMMFYLIEQIGKSDTAKELLDMEK